MADYFVKAEIERLAAMAGEGAEPGDRNDRLRLELERLAATIGKRQHNWGEYLRSELDRLAALSPERLQREIVPGSWVGHVGGERRYSDDQDAGRIAWRAVGQRARHGQKALSEGKMELAEACMREAQAFECAAYRARMKPGDFKALGVGARTRGRRQASEADAAIAAAVDAELPAAEGNIAAAIKAARARHPGLLDHLTTSGAREAYDRGKKRRQGLE